MKILHVVPSINLAYGGPSRTTVHLANNLAVINGCEVYFYTYEELNEDRLEFFPEVFAFTRICSRYYRLVSVLRDFYRIKSILKEFDIDIVHIHGVWHPLGHFSAKAASCLNVPYIIQPRGMLEPWAMKFRWLKKKFAMSIYQKSDLRGASGFIATSDQEAHSLRVLCKSDHVAVIPNGVELLSNNIFVSNKSYIKTALFMSRIHPKKGVYELVGAWEKLKPEGWFLRIVGPDDGGHLARIRRLVNRLQLEDMVKVVGPLYGESREIEYARADLFILPTYSENFGIAIAEALSYGIPVLTTTGAPWSSIVDNKCGWWIDPGEESLVDALPKALSISDAERFEMGSRAKKLAANFEWGSVAQQTLDFYSKVISESKNNLYKY
ncbi:glycosyltransferase [Limnobacter sp.]|uniref:glycosyltransferase n=1 Tax=Limnobacter sp. TaxID=2003368 RepID=UPI003BABA6F4